MTPAFPVAIAAAFLGLALCADHLGAQSRGTAPAAEPIYTVASMAQLRPVSTDERLRAEFYDHSGIPISETANKVLLHNPNETLPPPPVTPGSVQAKEPLSREVMLQRAVCRDDAVVVAVAKSRRVLLNRQETAFFTDFAVDVTNFVKPNRGPGPIVVSQRGGEVKVGADIFSRPSLSPLLLGRPLLLFLRQIPKTQSFDMYTRPVPILEGMTDPASIGSARDIRGPQPLQEVVNELRQMATSCSGR